MFLFQRSDGAFCLQYPQLNYHFRNDPDPRAIIQQTYTILTKMIYRLHLIRLWGYGFPDLSLYTFILNQYLLSVWTLVFSVVCTVRRSRPISSRSASTCRLSSRGGSFRSLQTWVVRSRDHQIVPFFCLFRLWDYVMTVGFVGLFRIAVGLFALHGPEIMTCEIVSFSDLLNHIGTTFLAQESNVQTLFATMASLAEVGAEYRCNAQINEQTFAEYREQYEELHRVE